MKEPGGVSTVSTADRHVQRANLRQVNSVRVNVEAERVSGTRRSKSYAKADVSSGEGAPPGINGLVVKGKKKRRCARCDTQLGRFFNSGSPCPTCNERICNSHGCRIRIYLPNNKKTWMCMQCVKERQRRVSSGEWMLRKADLLMRDPVSLMTNPMESLTLPRGPMHRNSVPATTLPRSQSTITNGNIQTAPRAYSIVSDPAQHEYYTATRGRPVTTPGIVATKKKHAPPVPRPNPNIQLTTVPASVLQQKNIKSATLGRPASTLVFPSKEVREREDSSIVVTTLKRPKTKGTPTPLLKEKYIHIEFNKSPPLEPSGYDTLAPNPNRREPNEIHPRLLNAVGGINPNVRSPVKSATLDRDYRVYVQRTASYTEGTSPSPSWHNRLSRNGSQFEASTSRMDPLDLSAVTLPRVAKRTKRDDTLDPSTLAQHSDHSLSLLNLGVGTLTKPQTALRKAVSGIQHPSYASAFSRGDTTRKSFIERSGSTRRSNRSLRSSFRQQDDALTKLIWNTIALDYDDFLTVVKSNLQTIAVYYLNPFYQPLEKRKSKTENPLHVSIIEIKPPVEVAGPSESPKTLLSSRNSFRVTDIVPDVQLVLQESTDMFPPHPLPSSFHLSSARKVLHPEIEPPREKEEESSFERTSSFERRNSMPRRRPISPAVPFVQNSPEPKPKPRSSLQPSQLNDPPAVKISPRPSPKVPPKFESRSESEVFLNGLPKLREVGRPSATEQNTEPSDNIPEFQRVLEKFRERKKLQEEEVIEPPPGKKTLEATNSRKVDDTETVAAAFQHFRKVNEEVQDLKDFLKTARDSTTKRSEVAKLESKTETQPSVLIEGATSSGRSFTTQDIPPTVVHVTSDHVAQPVVAQEIKPASAEPEPLQFVGAKIKNTRLTVEEPSPDEISRATSIFVTHDVPVTFPKLAGGFHLASARKVFGVVPVLPAKDQPKNQDVEEPQERKVEIVGEPTGLLSESSVLTVAGSTVVVVSSSDSKENSSSSSFEHRRPERAKWHSSLLQTSQSFNASMATVDSFAYDDDVEHHVTKSYRDDVRPIDLKLAGGVTSVNITDGATLGELSDDVMSPTDEELPAKRCVPSVKRAAIRSCSSSDGEDYVEADFEDESDHEEHDEGDLEPSTKACRKVDAMEVQSEEVETFDDFDLWEMEAQPIVAPYDLFGRLQIPLDTIFEESEDEEKDSAYAHSGTMTRKAMRPVSDFDDLSPDELEEEKPEANGWHGDEAEAGEPTQPDLERYFTTGLLQPSLKRPYLKDNFDNLDRTVPNKVPEEPSIFKSARLRFASADYRLSSDNDVDDLSPSNPSDDENDFY